MKVHVELKREVAVSVVSVDASKKSQIVEHTILTQVPVFYMSTAQGTIQVHNEL